MQLPEPRDFCSTWAGTESCERDRRRPYACNRPRCRPCRNRYEVPGRILWACFRKWSRSSSSWLHRSRTYRERHNAWETGSSEISRIYTTCRCSCRALRSRTSQRTDRIQMDRRSDCEPRGSRRSWPFYLRIWRELRIPCRTLCTW